MIHVQNVAWVWRVGHRRLNTPPGRHSPARADSFPVFCWPYAGLADLTEEEETDEEEEDELEDEGSDIAADLDGGVGAAGLCRSVRTLSSHHLPWLFMPLSRAWSGQPPIFRALSCCLLWNGWVVLRPGSRALLAALPALWGTRLLSHRVSAFLARLICARPPPFLQVACEWSGVPRSHRPT